MSDFALRPPNPYLEGPILRALLRLATPIVLANLLQTGYQITDAFWVGRLGAAAVAAVSVSFPVTFLMIAIGSGLAVAGSTLAAQYAGARNHTMVDHVAGQTMLMVIGVSAVLALPGILLTPAILHVIGVSPTVFSQAVGFMRVSFAGLVFVFAFAMFQALMRGVGRAVAPLYIVLVTVLLNFALDPLFIFGWGPIPASGVMGAALATLSTQALATVVALLMMLRGTYGIALRIRELKPDLTYIRRAFRLGFPASIELSARALGLIVMSLLVTSFGTSTLAAYGIGSTVLQIATIPAMGLSMAAASMVGQNIGAGQPDRAVRVTRVAVILGLAVLSTIGGVVYASSHAVVRFFFPGDMTVVEQASIFLRATAPAWGFIAVQLTIVSTFRAAGNMLAALVMALVSQWVLQFPLAYALSRPAMLGTAGLWWSFTLTNLISAVAAWLWYSRGAWLDTPVTGSAPSVVQTAAVRAEENHYAGISNVHRDGSDS